MFHLPKHVLMCPPTYFEVAYEINVWMHKSDPVDVALAFAQWQMLHDIYASLRYDIALVEPVDGLPDMVFTANGGLAIGGKAALSRFKHPERRHETPMFDKWFRDNALETFQPQHLFEGEGDCLHVGGTLFAGHGFRSDERSHAELGEFFGLPVVSLRLVDPRFYHLDTALSALTDDTVMYYPGAFDEDSLAAIKQHFPHRIEASEHDAAMFGLNAVSDGENVLLSATARTLIHELRRHGFRPIGLDMTEFRKSGGAVKCCTLELHAQVADRSSASTALVGESFP